MQFKFDVTPLIWIVLIIAALGGIFSLVGPQIMQALDIQNQMAVQKEQANVQIAQQKAQAAVAPTLTALDAQLKAAEVLSTTNAIKYAELKAQSDISATNALADANSTAIKTKAQSDANQALIDAQRNADIFKTLGISLAGLSLIGAGGTSAYLILKKRGEHKIEHKRLELQQGEIEVKKMQVEVLKKAVDNLSQTGGEMILDNGHRLVFRPQLQLEAKVEVPSLERKSIKENVVSVDELSANARS